ncbi:MAG: KH domain-containing protein, partial [Roseibacillus sp.]|nr:KH domain-containing protein [Roseibacillus sp.]
YELRCNKEDLGKVIGKSGKTVGAIRALLSALSSRKGRKAVLEIVE